MTILAVTGHRPDKLGGYGDANREALVAFATDHLRRRRPERVIIGMAQGWDTAAALGAISLKIPFIAAVAFPGQPGMWPLAAKMRFLALLEMAERVEHVTDGSLAPADALNRRNRWMVDNALEVDALWDGSSGGTANCIAYAERRGRPVKNLWPEWMIARLLA